LIDSCHSFRTAGHIIASERDQFIDPTARMVGSANSPIALTNHANGRGCRPKQSQQPNRQDEHRNHQLHQRETRAPIETVLHCHQDAFPNGDIVKVSEKPALANTNIDQPAPIAMPLGENWTESTED
jgi:hypothetical protein